MSVVRDSIVLALAAVLMIACSSIECSMDNVVACKWKLQKAEGDTVFSKMYVSVSSQRLSDGNDTVLINRMTNASQLLLPMSYALQKDTFLLTFEKTNGEHLSHIVTDTVFITKTNEPVFEAVECHPKFNHTITAVSSSNNMIESVKVNHNFVSKDVTKENLLINLRSFN